LFEPNRIYTSKELANHFDFQEMKNIFQSTTKICSTLWSPQQQQQRLAAYSRVSGFRERKNHKKHPWDEKTKFVFQKLFEWREMLAQERSKLFLLLLFVVVCCCLMLLLLLLLDEAPGYICPSALLLQSSERLPTTSQELSILVSPVPHSMRTTTTTATGVVFEPVDLPAAVQQALLAWEATTTTTEEEEGEAKETRR
jgi:hypothetical protein